MEYLRDIRQLSDLPVTKKDIMKYVALRYLMNHNAIFQPGITEITDIDNWRERNEFSFKFRSKKLPIDTPWWSWNPEISFNSISKFINLVIVIIHPVILLIQLTWIHDCTVWWRLEFNNNQVWPHTRISYPTSNCRQRWTIHVRVIE